MISRPKRIISTQPKDTLHVRFLPTDICNFHCSYCFPGQTDGKCRYPKNVKTVIKNLQRVFDMYSEKLDKKKFHLFISGGGEPTIWPDIEEFCEGIKSEHDVFITLVTNGSRTLKWWENNSHFFNDVVLSCHNEFVDIDHHIQVADYLFEKQIKVSVLMLMDAKNWSKCVNHIEKMKLTSKHQWFIEAKAVVDAPGRGMDVYTQDQLEYLSQGIKRIPESSWMIKWLDSLRIYESIVEFDNGNFELAKGYTHIVSGWNYFKGWTCEVSLESLVINFDGTVTGSCQEPVFGNKKFNLFSEKFLDEFDDSVEFKSIVCSRDHCGCQPETHISKINFLK